MKSKIKTAALLFSGVAMFATPAMAVTTANGDLLIGFYQVVSGTVQANTYVFNLGSASLYRENTLNNVSVTTVNTGLASGNIGADLTATFGSNWANAGTVYWTIFGGTNNGTSGALNGDVARTPYISLPVSTYTTGVDTTTQPSGTAIDSTKRGGVASAISAINAGSNGTGTNVGNAAGAKIAASGILGTSVDSFFPPTTNTQLTLGTELRGLFGAGTVAGSTGLEGALDVYRYTNSITPSTGVDLTVGRTPGNATLGTGQYIGTFTIDSLGNLGIGQISAVPEPSGALALGLIGTLAGLGYRSRRSVKLA